MRQAQGAAGFPGGYQAPADKCDIFVCDTCRARTVYSSDWIHKDHTAGRRAIATGMEEMFREHWSLVLGYLTHRVRDRSVAEELAAETFYRATRAFLGWRGESPPAWLLAIARNVLVDAARKDRKHVALDERSLRPAEPLDDDVSVRLALDQLPEAERRLLLLVHVYGYSCPEVAAMTGTTSGAIRTALYRARAAARETLS